MSKILKCHPGIGDKTEGIVLCAKDNFSARYDLDRIKGVFSRPAHKLFGENYLDKVLVLNISKGGVASAWMLYEMVTRKMAPIALLLNYANPIMAQGAAHANLSMIDRFDDDITTMIKTGEEVTVEPITGKVVVEL